MLVAERGGAVVGYVFGGMEGYDYMALRGPAGVIYDLMVDPGTVARASAGADGSGAREHGGAGAPRALLFTAEKNHVAQSMFERAGFRRTMIEMTREL